MRRRTVDEFRFVPAMTPFQAILSGGRPPVHVVGWRLDENGESHLLVVDPATGKLGEVQENVRVTRVGPVT